MSMKESDADRAARLGHELERVRGLLFEARNEGATLRLALANTEAQLRGVTSSLELAWADRTEYKEDAERARRELYLALRAGIGNSYALSQMDPRDREAIYVDNFLAGCDLTARDLTSMFEFEREKFVPYLRKHAAYIYSVPNGRRPDRDKFQAINSFLNIFDPKFSNRLLTVSR